MLYDILVFRKYFNKEEPDTNVDVNINKFIEYCNYIEDNPNELNKQWQELEIKSEEMYSELSNYFSVLPENKRKNRFTNILPCKYTAIRLYIIRSFFNLKKQIFATNQKMSIIFLFRLDAYLC